MAVANDPLTIIQGDALSSLRELESESVQTCVTSPPYWGLRDYGVDKIVWDAAEGCDHQWGDSITVNATNHTDKRRWNHTRNGRDELQPVEKRVAWLRTVVDQGNVCEKCGAWRGCLGLEPTPDLYASHLVQIFREMKRVIRSDGSFWLNLGDSYAGSWGNYHPNSPPGKHGQRKKDTERFDRPGYQSQEFLPPTANFKSAEVKPKDLVGIPWLVAFALRADGWYLRSDIIWSKPNPMPESVTDRPTKSHEYIFLLSKSERYYYNAKAIAEPLDCPEELDRKTPAKFGGANKWAEAQKQSRLHSGNEYKRKPQTNGKWSTEDPQSSGRRIVENVARARAEGGAHDSPFGDTRNKRSVWTVTTKPFKDAHFATFPPDLIKPCILAGSEAGAVVLDPFGGSGTTGKVAIELGRKAILIEPKAEYIEMIKKRCQTTIGLPLAI